MPGRAGATVGPFADIHNNQAKRPAWPVSVNEANDLNALSGVFNVMLHLKIFRLGRTEGLTVVAGLVETANLLLAGCKHIAGIDNSFCARLKLLG